MKGIVSFLGIFLLLGSVHAQPAVGDKVPTFYLRTAEGEPFFLSHYVGSKAKQDLQQPVVLSFFATWCVPCKAEIPKLQQLQSEFPKVKFYLVNVEEKPDLVRKYIAANNINLPILMDVYSIVAKKYGIVNDENVAVLPHVVVIGTDSKLLYTHEGYQAGDEAMLKESLQNITN